MNRRGIEACELQSIVEIGLIAAVGLSRSFPRRLEILDDGGPLFGAVDADDPPRLTVADGRREVGEAQKPVDQRLRNGVALEAAHVAAPTNKLFERRRRRPALIRFIQRWRTLQVVRLARSHCRKASGSEPRQKLNRYIALLAA